MASAQLRRYTSLASALDVLESKTLTLLPPSSWDDETDRSLMAAYQRRRKLRAVLALCFSEKSETYHHWKVFTEGSSGACIVFERKLLVDAVSSKGVIVKPITYKTIAQDRMKPVTTAGLPFTKRSAFKDEGEVRMVFASADEDLKALRVPYPVESLEALSLSPWTPDALVESLRASIARIPGLPHLEVRKSSIFGSSYWRRIADA